MRTFPLFDKNGRLFAFEIGNLLIGRRGVCKVVERIKGPTLTRRPKLFSWPREDVFCEFAVDGESFVAVEPFGDNSRYWIGPNPARWVPQTEKVHEAFKRS